MDVRWMKVFMAVAEELNFGRAAQQLNLSQSAVSQQISNLEKHLGVRLFDRDQRSVRLTDAGFAFRQPCRTALQAIEVAGLEARNSGSGESGTIRIVFNSGFAADALATWTGAVRRRYPQVVLRIGPSRRNVEVVRLVEEDEFDIGFMGGPVGGKGLVKMTIGSARLGILLPNDHPLAELPEIPTALLRGQSFVLVSAPTGGVTLRSMAEEAFDAAGFRPTDVTEVTDGMTLQALVRAGVGLALTTTNSFGMTARGLAAVPIAEPIEAPICLIWKSDAHSRAVHNVLALARSLFKG